MIRINKSQKQKVISKDAHVKQMGILLLFLSALRAKTGRGWNPALTFWADL
jgi:hypothetical protein